MKNTKIRAFFRAFCITLIMLFCATLIVVGFAVCDSRNEKSLLGKQSPKNIVEFWGKMQ